MLKKFVSYYKPYKKLFFLDLFVATISALCDLFYPMITREIANNSIPNREIRAIGIFAGVLLVIYLIKMLCAYFMQYWGHLVGVGMQADMRRDIYKHLQNLPIRYFDNNQTGSIMSRIVNDLQDISELAHHGPEDLFISFFMIIGAFAMLIRINIQLTLIIFCLLPLILLYSMFQRKRLLAVFMKTREKTGDINARLQNSISGIRVSKAFVINENERERFEKDNQKFVEAKSKSYKIMAEYTAGVGFLTDLLDYVVLIFGGLFTYWGKIGIGDFLAYLLYIKIFTQPIKRLIAFVEQFQNGMSGFKRFMELIGEEEEGDKVDAIDMGKVEGEIDLQNVSFDHEDKSVLKNISLKISKGKMLALVGPSGGGKTTLCNLIPRFYNIKSGDIKIDGKSIYDVKLESLRKNIGIVQQDVFLFTGTIKENILVGNSEATDEEVMIAAKKANIHDLIMEMPEGYNTFVGERGVKLSGGQKQRIAIARIFLKNPPILILDEATSALDNITERLIQNSLEELCKGRTTIVVAHRLSTIQNADEIIVLTDNGIEERGTHQELLANKGFYHKLYNMSQL
ncbi:ABC transporter ATP-binding protein [uncultured Fusobacterium sp.]|uniref:ABC transporter ATP-binding protein n=1 Tax=uncultured Fusobacterium sp. TaxID=159267 RepID=UPI0025DA6ADE|nr:ABC transporter ATP-binding protein [uncultured Fusobacterium sp.]MCF2640751.1 ABC transporter ATP-binding protein [Fusobacterium varium]